MSDNVKQLPKSIPLASANGPALTPDQVRDIRVSTESQLVLAQKYNLNASSILNIISGRTYQSVKGVANIPDSPEENVHVLIEIEDKMNMLTASGDICDAASSSAVSNFLWRMLFDQETKAFYVEPVFSETDYLNLSDFLLRAWDKKRDNFFYGKPDVLKLSAKTTKNLPGISDWLSNQGLKIESIGKNSGSFIGAASVWLQCTSCLDLSDHRSSITKDELQKIASAWQSIAFAAGWYQRHGINPSSELGLLEYPERIGYKLNFVNSPVYFARHETNDHVSRFKLHWNGPKLKFK